MRRNKMVGAVVAATAGALVLSGCSSTKSLLGAASTADSCAPIHAEVKESTDKVIRWNDQLEGLFSLGPRNDDREGIVWMPADPDEAAKWYAKRDDLQAAIDNEFWIVSYTIVDNKDCFTTREVAQAQTMLEQLRSN